MNQPLVSIVVPIYNVEDYLPICLESLIHQTYTNIEIIAVNDGSRDNSLEVVEKYSKLDERIVIISQDNQGLSAARNTGIRHATGKYICFIDSDDWIDVQTCEVAVKNAENQCADVVLWNYIKEYGETSVKVHCIPSAKSYDETSIHLLRQRIVGPVGRQLSTPQYIDSLSTAWGKLFLTDLIKRNQIEFVSIKEIGTEDLLFNVQYFQCAQKACLLTDFFSHYRKDNGSSLTSTYKPNLFNQWQNLQGRLSKIVEGDSLLTDAFYNRVALSIIGLGLNETDSNKTFKEKKKQIKSYLQSSRYREAYKRLELRHFPFHWKIFFFCAKYKLISILLILLFAIRSFINRHGS